MSPEFVFFHISNPTVVFPNLSAAYYCFVS